MWSRHQTRRLVEPFCGGLAVALGLQPRVAHLSDANPHLINFYTWLQRGLTVSIPLRNQETQYYAYRDRFNDLLRTGHEQSVEAAVFFYYLNRTGYNGLCRFNQSGEFNVPFGRYSAIRYVKDFAPYTRALRHWRFASQDFEAAELGDTDFVYADPPYDVQFTQYSKGGFTWADQVRTAEWLSRHKGPVVISNQATDRILKLYQKLGYTTETLMGRRMISCTGDRTPALEVLAFRNL
jgi:DNA adenine methylase